MSAVSGVDDSVQPITQSQCIWSVSPRLPGDRGRRRAGKYHPDRRHLAAADMHRKYGPVVAERLPGRYSLVHLFSADDFRTLYQEEGKMPFRMGATAFKKYRESRPQYYANIGILNLQGQEWYNVRSKTQPYTLRPRTIMSYVPGMDLIAEDALQLIHKTRDDKKEVDDCYTILYRWALETSTNGMDLP
ncbi:hypothetical protein HPB51_005175 [Rhipicephalus microplus]|uniref:Cytochrome n=1 Tax=Rhipicephalus microplus TaxID=6941 RepID=A0A9J6DKX5_RHIMP|nr:hypothetical protein HPB51_005175 [Rhipicephalus microplus]